MSVSTVTALALPQWRMMNALDGTGRQSATKLIKRCDADREDLLDLYEAGLITSQLNDLAAWVQRRPLTDGSEPVDLIGVQIWLTPAGSRWVNENPNNRALGAVDEIGGAGRVSLVDAARKADVELSAYLLLVADGLVTIVQPDGHELGPNDTLALRLYRTSLRVRLTCRGQLVVNS